MISKLLSFFIPKENNFIEKEEMDLLIETVSKGFSFHRNRLVSLEQASVHTAERLRDIDSKLSAMNPGKNGINEVKAELFTCTQKQGALEQKLSGVLASISSSNSQDVVHEMMQHLTSMNQRLKAIESREHITRTDIQQYHSTIQKQTDEKISDAFKSLSTETEEKIDSLKTETPPPQPQMITKEVVTEIDREIDVSDLTDLEKNILKTLVELKVKSNVSSITITDLTNLLYPEGAVSTKRPTVSAYITKLERSGFLMKERKNNSVFVSIIKDKVVDYFTRENYTHLKKVI